MAYLFNEDGFRLGDENLDEGWQQRAHVADLLRVYPMQAALSVVEPFAFHFCDKLLITVLPPSVFLLCSSSHHVQHAYVVNARTLVVIVNVVVR